MRFIILNLLYNILIIEFIADVLEVSAAIKLFWFASVNVDCFSMPDLIFLNEAELIIILATIQASQYYPIPHALARSSVFSTVTVCLRELNFCDCPKIIPCL